MLFGGPRSLNLVEFKEEGELEREEEVVAPISSI